jgi:2-succinyl-5-enolpyruvyl-6-hydroxy-3-cyclohexene-1-carboxylate synthase
LSFIYDSNGLWNKYLTGKFKIIVLNNGGANIFRIIGNDEVTASCQEFFDAPHQVNLKALTEAFGHHHLLCEKEEDLLKSLSALQDVTTQVAVLEIRTKMEDNVEAYKGLFKYLKENTK